MAQMANRDHAELIRLVGSKLWGSRWQTEMAVALGVNDRTVRRWASGAQAPEPGIWAGIAEIIQQRRTELGELLDVVELHARSAGDANEVSHF
jgi:hypothetical protein